MLPGNFLTGGPRSLPSNQQDAFQSNQTVHHAWDLSGPPAEAFTPVRVLQVYELIELKFGIYLKNCILSWLQGVTQDV